MVPPSSGQEANNSGVKNLLAALHCDASVCMSICVSVYTTYFIGAVILGEPGGPYNQQVMYNQLLNCAATAYNIPYVSQLRITIQANTHKLRTPHKIIYPAKKGIIQWLLIVPKVLYTAAPDLCNLTQMSNYIIGKKFSDYVLFTIKINQTKQLFTNFYIQISCGFVVEHNIPEPI